VSLIESMKKDIHPKYDIATKATCACGAVFLVGSTMPEIKMEICSKCHPFYSGNEKIIDSAGRVDRFNKRKALSAKAKK
jgi:large subunit ribosomal protein L31